MLKVDRHSRETYQDSDSKPSDVRVIQLNFAEGIDTGMNPINALKRCPPSSSEAINERRLKACVGAGMTTIDIAKGFSCKPHIIYQHCSKYQIKLGKKVHPVPEEEAQIEEFSPDVPECNSQFIGDSNVELTSNPELITGDNLDVKEVASPNGIEIFDGKSIKGHSTSFVMPPEEIKDQFVYIFGIRPVRFPQVRIRKNGIMVFSGCNINVEKKYVFECTHDFKKIKLVYHDEGFSFSQISNIDYFEKSCAPMIKEMKDKGIILPAVYKFDPETLIGELISSPK